jgi:hypothetical protein
MHHSTVLHACIHFPSRFNAYITEPKTSIHAPLDNRVEKLEAYGRSRTKLMEVRDDAKRNLLSLSRTKDLLMTIEQLQSDALNQLS